MKQFQSNAIKYKMRFQTINEYTTGSGRSEMISTILSSSALSNFAVYLQNKSAHKIDVVTNSKN